VLQEEEEEHLRGRPGQGREGDLGELIGVRWGGWRRSSCNKYWAIGEKNFFSWLQRKYPDLIHWWQWESNTNCCMRFRYVVVVASSHLSFSFFQFSSFALFPVCDLVAPSSLAAAPPPFFCWLYTAKML